MPILGIIASSVLKVTNSYESIATVTVGSGGSTNVTFSSIPATYKHLQVRLNIRSDRSVTFENVNLTFNSTGSNQYAGHQLTGNGSSASAYAETGQNAGLGPYVAGNSAGSNIFGAVVFDILDYANTNKFKTTRALGGTDLNGSGGIAFTSNLWQNTSAINSIRFTSGGTGWTEYSSFALYGVRG